MNQLIHFALFAGVVIVSIMGATMVLDALGVPMVAGFGWDDALLGTVAAAGITFGTILLKKVA